jgi:diguanylate cyclase (GGDEF)-like protein
MPERSIVLLLIDDDEVDRKAVSRTLSPFRLKYELHEAGDGRSGIALARSKAFDCIVLDYNLPDMNGLELLDRLRNDEGIVVPVVILTGSGNEDVAVEAMKRGANDYIRKSHLEPGMLSRAVDNAILKSSLQHKLVEANHALHRLALYDSLTGLGNRNLFYEHLPRAISLARHEGASFPLLFMDLNAFKVANDAFGHEAGDAVLTGIGSRLRAISRAADVYFRIGGDEFTAILHAGSDGSAAARRIVGAVAEPFQFGTTALAVGVSVGVANYPADGEDAEALVGSADDAMYRAKKAELGWAAASDFHVH